MWYQGYGGMGVPQMGVDNSKSPWRGFDPLNLLYTIGLATSKDGIFWERPNLRLVEYNGSRDTNIVLSDAAFGNVIEDSREPDPNRLYKALFFEARSRDGTPNIGDRVSVAFSPDGLSWARYEGNPVITRSSDSHMLLGWDDLHGKYVAYCRPSVHKGNKTRRIGRSVSEDFLEWTDPEDVLAPDDADPPGMEFYGMPVFKYEGLYLGQLYAYHAPPEEPQIRFAGKMKSSWRQVATAPHGSVWVRGSRSFPTGPPEASIQAKCIRPESLPLWETSSGFTTQAAPANTASPAAADPYASPSSVWTGSCRWTPARRPALSLRSRFAATGDGFRSMPRRGVASL